MSASPPSSGPAPPGPPHRSVVLFYKYFLTDGDGGGNGCADAAALFRFHADHYVPLLCEQQRELCGRLGMRGRVLLSGEGVNGTLSAPDDGVMKEYIDAVEGLDLVEALGPPPTVAASPSPAGGGENHRYRLFADVDWKASTVDEVTASKAREPFPDLKVSAVNEIVSTGGAIDLDDISEYGGKHLSPAEFHESLLAKTGAGGEKKEIVLIDVRNTFEHAVGHFINPTLDEEAAINPQMTSFASFDTDFCARNADNFRDKKVLMYCTGGIRCEKASAMLRKRGVDDVSQLSGGIHRYLEKYGDGGLFKGKNFVFDQRVTIAPGHAPDGCSYTNGASAVDECSEKSDDDQKEETGNVVGKCIECLAPFDEISGSRICTVCRDLVLVCPKCQEKLREYHCSRHSEWKDCYFTFLDIYDESELTQQEQRLIELREALVPPSAHKNVRRTLMRQAKKTRAQIEDIKAGKATADRSAPRRCRTCGETEDTCDGLCWGFWKRTNAKVGKEGANKHDGEDGNPKDMNRDEILPIGIGDRVQPGPHWNDLRLGSRTLSDGLTFMTGGVVEIKSWGSGGMGDCVSVLWNDVACGGKKPNSPVAKPKIYRWGALAKNGQRMYDVEKVASQNKMSP